MPYVVQDVTLNSVVQGINDRLRKIETGGMSAGTAGQTPIRYDNPRSPVLLGAAAGGTVTLQRMDGPMSVFAVAATSNFVFNLTGRVASSTQSAITLAEYTPYSSSNPTTGYTVLFGAIVAQGASPKYCTGITIDGVSQTVYWLGGAPTAGTTNSYDYYEIMVTQTGPSSWIVTAQLLNTDYITLGAIKTYYQPTAPTGTIAVGSLWFDTDANMEPWRWNGSSWVTVRDGNIAVAQSTANTAVTNAAAAQSTADTALTNAATAQTTANTAVANAATAQGTATAAQTTANGKNAVFYSVGNPTGSGTKVGDIWWKYSGGNVVGYWTWDGSSWQAQSLDGSTAVITNIDAGKITTGTLSAAIYIQGPIIRTGSSNPKVQIDTNGIWAWNSGGTQTFRVDTSGNLTATSASITGAVTATSGSIGNFNVVGGDYLQYGSTYLYGSSTSGSYCLQDSARGIAVKEVFIYGTDSNSLNATQGTIGTLWTTTAHIDSLTGNTGGLGITASTVTTSSSFYNAGLSGRSVVVSGSPYQIGSNSSSSRRYKQDIAPSTFDASPLLDMPMQQFRYIKDVQENGDDAVTNYGLMAEDVADRGLEWLIDRNEKGEPDYIYWSERMPQALLSLIQQQQKQIDALTARIEALEAAK